ncbi:hypothetical protein QBC37DRAFT_386210 [Rhypophila decipiens]|uniref:Uncharacterized protein n=1 Tax=Rhypophila decipiens TaxID=261697 RepID=A0AAN7B958_9PEZI|nr:hypothetical protein QBC37DRAFT_386210 [Rhypophila decipiens]
MQPVILVMYWAQNRCIWCQFEFRDGQDTVTVSLVRHILDSGNKPPEVEPLGECVYLAEGVAFLQKNEIPTGRAINQNQIRFHGCHDVSNAQRDSYHNIRKVICAHVHCEQLVRAQAMAPFVRFKGMIPFHLSQPLTHSFPVPPFPFSPPVHEERRRARYIQDELANNLQRDVSGHLPLELWMQVGAHMLHECASLTAVERVRAESRDKKDNPMILDLSGYKSVYASYVKIDGKPYVKTLHHDVPPAVHPKGVVTVPIYRAQGETWKRLIPGNKTAQPTKRRGLHLILAHDHVGIRQAFLASVTDIDKFWDRRPDIPDVWWRHIRLGVGRVPSLITMKTSLLDTILAPPQKLRDTLFKSLLKNTDKRRPWSQVPSTFQHSCIQVPPTFHHSWDPLPRRPISFIGLTVDRWIEAPSWSYSNILMSSFECNAPDTIGYSALFDSRNLIGVVAHKTGDDMKLVREKFTDLEKATISTSSPAPPYWVYIPIDEGEFIVDIVCRPLFVGGGSFQVGYKDSLCSIGFSTNKGRTVEFGTAERYWSDHRLRGAARFANPAAGKAVRVWYNRCDALPNRHDSQLLAFEDCSTSYLMETGYESWSSGPRHGDGPPVFQPPEMLPGMSGPKVGWAGIDKPPEDLNKKYARLKGLSAISRYSECSLREVREIEIAFGDNFFGDRIVTGLLLRYADGRHEAVGSFRPDRVDPSRGSIRVGPNDYLSFQFVGDKGVETVEGVCRWVGDVSCHEYFRGQSVISPTEGFPPDEDGQGDQFSLNVTQNGTLAWCVFGWRDRVKWFPDVETRLGKRLT